VRGVKYTPQELQGNGKNSRISGKPVFARFAGKAKAKTPPGSGSDEGEFVFTSGITCRDQSDTFCQKENS
jgi:hypothetical protein